MKIKTFILQSMLLVCASVRAQNLFSNPGFESGNTGWNLQINSSGAATANYTFSPARTGTNACQVEVTEAATDNWRVQLNTPAWTAAAEKKYRMSFYGKSNQNASIHVAVQGGSPDYTYLTGTESSLSAGADWKKIEIVYTATASGMSAVNFNLFLGASVATYVFDDFMLEDITTTYPGAPTPPTLGAYYTDVYRNLFVELGKSETDVNAKVEAAFHQIFHGDSATERLYYEFGNDMAYILAPDAMDIRTEGLSYGMMIAVQLNKKTEFDKLWKFSKTYAQHASGSRKGYFAWQLNPTEPFAAKDQNSASDGEEYFAMALFFAGHRWGDGDGIFNYTAEAKQILHDMIHKEEDNGGIIDGITNMFDLNQKQVVFVPQGNSALFTDPSYHLPGFYKLWSKWGSVADSSFWSAAADTSREFLIRAAHPTSGLVTDYMTFEGKPQTTSFNENSVRFAYDSWRVAGNIGMYTHWFGSKDWTLNFNNKLLGFFVSQGAGYLGLYEQDGTVLTSNNYHNAGLVSMNAVGALSTNQVATSWPFVEELWNTNVPGGTYRYYDGLLYMLSILHASGNFKIWKPGDITSISKDLNSNSKLTIYPNPGKNVTIEALENYEIAVNDISGRMVWNGDVQSWNRVKPSLEKGIYLLNVKNAMISSQKFVIE